MTDNEIYYRHRIVEELAAADAAEDAGISNIHRDMAQRYRELMSRDAALAQSQDGSGVQPGILLA